MKIEGMEFHEQFTVRMFIAVRRKHPIIDEKDEAAMMEMNAAVINEMLIDKSWPDPLDWGVATFAAVSAAILPLAFPKKAGESDEKKD
jgi:hypothetical protein